MGRLASSGSVPSVSGVAQGTPPFGDGFRFRRRSWMTYRLSPYPKVRPCCFPTALWYCRQVIGISTLLRGPSHLLACPAGFRSNVLNQQGGRTGLYNRRRPLGRVCPSRNAEPRGLTTDHVVLACLSPVQSPCKAFSNVRRILSSQYQRRHVTI